MSAAPAKQIRWARPRVDWTDEVRELVTELYQRQNRPLKEVVRTMQVQHGFSATYVRYWAPTKLGRSTILLPAANTSG